MMIRKLSFLMPENAYKKVEVDIYNEEKICVVYVENNGYSIYVNNKENEMFLIKTGISPEEFKSEEYGGDKEDFINLIKLLLNQIYDGSDIPEYEEQHHEFVFLKIMDLFVTNLFEAVDDDSDLHKTIELAFIKFDIDLLNLSVFNNKGD